MRVAAAGAAILFALSASAARRGGIAFHYATPLTLQQLDFYSRFEVLVTHDPLPREQVAELHRRGTRLALYEWAVAFYASLKTPWHATLPPSALLNEHPLRGYLGAADSDAFYFDPASETHRRERAEQLVRKLAAIGYDGVFLDTTTSESVHPAALAEFRRRHPRVSYDRAYAGFLKNLRDARLLIVTNQGYRHAAEVLPYVDWDVTESLITRPSGTAFVLRPWNDPRDRWNSTAWLFRKLITPAQRRYRHVRFAHINYVSPPDEKAVEEIVAIARLYDHDAFVARPDLATGIETDLYFLDLGKPRPRVETSSGAWREFERGFVAVNRGSQPMRAGRRVVPPGSAVIEGSD